MTNIPLASVSIITYNHEAYIAKAIEGALMQKTNFPFEIVVGDDCSTDRTREICIAYQKKYPHIIRLRLPEKNMGSIKNWLTNVAECKGKYIAWLEGDDYWTDENKLQEQVDFLEKNHEFSMSFTNVHHVDSNGNVVRETPVTFHKDIYTQDDLVPLVIPPSLTTVFRKEFLPAVMPDIFFTIKNSDGFIKALISGHGPVKYFNKVTGHYRIHNTGIFSGASYAEKNQNKIESFSAILKYFPSRQVKQNARIAISNLYLKLSYYHLRKFDFFRFIVVFFSGLKFSISNGQLPTLNFIKQKVSNKIKRQRK